MGKNNAQFIDAAALKDIKAKNCAGNSQKQLAVQYGVSPTTVGFAIRAHSVAEFKKLLTERSSKEVAARRERKAATTPVNTEADEKQNQKAKEVAAEKIKDLGYAYTPKQVKQLIDGLVEHVNNLEERLQTVTSLLITSDDNVVSRLYKLEGKKSWLRRFLEKF